MRWYLKVLLSLWFLAIVLLSLHALIDWESVETKRVESRLITLMEQQLTDLDRLVVEYALEQPLTCKGPFYFRQFNNGELEFWSDNKELPGYSELKKADSLLFIQSEAGSFIVQRKEVNKHDGLLEFFSILVLKSEFEIQNDYLQNSYNSQIFKYPPENLMKEGIHTIDWQGAKIFAINPSGTVQKIVFSIAMWCIFFSIPLIIYWIFLATKDKIKEELRLLWVISLLLVFRAIMWVLGFPGDYIRASVFNPIYYNSSLINSSLGDLMLNYVVLIIMALLFIRQFNRTVAFNRGKGVRWFLSLLLIALTYANVTMFYWSGWDLMRNSQIEFDITRSITFDLNRVMVYVILLLAAVFYFLINHLLARALSRMKMPGPLFIIFHILVLAFCVHVYADIFIIFLLQFTWYWVLYLSDFKLRFEAVHRVSLEYLLSIGAILSLSFAYLVHERVTFDELEAKAKFATKLQLNKDILAEYYLNTLVEEIRKDGFVASSMKSGFFARQNIKEKISRKFFNSYFDQYNIDIKLFDIDSTSFDIEGPDYGYFINQYARSNYRTDYPYIYSIKQPGRRDYEKYITFLPVENKGFLTIDVSRNQSSTAGVFPALLSESKYEQSFFNDIFDFAVYQDSTLIYGQGQYGYRNVLTRFDLKRPSLYDKGLNKSGIHYFGVRADENRVIVIASEAYRNRSWVVNFSFLFILWIFMISVVGIIYRLFLNYRDYSLSSKIQLYLTLGFLIPLFITGFALLNTLSASYREETSKDYLKRSLGVAENLNRFTQQYLSNQLDLDAYSDYVADVSKYARADLNIYSADGRLITTSQPGIFGLDLLSELINPKALIAFENLNQNILVDESIGELDFKTTYTAIMRENSGELMAILSLPFFESRSHLYVQQKEVFGDLLVIFAIIFLIALISGNYILGYIIGPLKLVADHMKRTSLEEANEVIHYSSKDEIGLVVKEYNNMLIKLEQNKKALARSQKESAWKEIARQVAHEIKNPLTPMRLKIQQMMRSVADAKQTQVLSSLITQIDSLAAIADSFSEFAKMPAPENTDFDLVELVDEACQLHSSDASIKVDLPTEKIMIWADPNILSGILNNLILNAIQSVVDKTPKLKVKVTRLEAKVQVCIKDNGNGIPEGIRHKIFTTYFSTKSTGSGIGLAVAKKGIENAGGEIWYETEMGKGTTFYFSLPAYTPL